jgi:hypothetical protein
MATGRRILLVAWALGCAGLACAQNLIVNGDFEGGNVGFSTDYFYSPGDIWLPGSYDVVYDVSDSHPLAELYHDHTTGAGLMLAVNAGLPDVFLVWSQTVPVTPGARYAFAAWAANWADGSQGHVAPLDFRINGTPVAFWETPVVGQWFPVSGNWDAGTATAAVITILDFSLEWDGNAPALDDLWLALLGDLNCDGRVNFGDINPFATALLDPVGYHAQYANCNIVDGDVNGDGLVNVADINPFVALLSASPGTGACCYADDSCVVTTLANCGGTWLGLNTTCDASPCPPTGACCYADGACAVTTLADCAGTWLGANTTCDPHPCEPLTYCWGGAEYCREYISRVQIDTINNASGCAILRYADYTYQATGWQALLDYGSSTTLTVTNGNARPADVCSVWVDWNQDYEFDDASDELIGDSGGVGPYVFSLHPPMTALPGQTRMRIRIGCSNDNPNPCGYETYGEVEDYTVHIGEVEGACCYADGSCAVTTPADCTGTWRGVNTTCDPNPCESPAGACCDDYSGTCDNNVEPLDCIGQGKRFQQGTLCQDMTPPCGGSITDDGRAFFGYSEFQLALDPNNNGVNLVRRLDYGIGDQVAAVHVDGSYVGDWSTPGACPVGGWLDATMMLPGDFTSGRTSISVRIQFVSSAYDWNEFHYWAYSLVNGQPVLTDTVDVGQAASEAAHNYVISAQNWSGTRTMTYCSGSGACCYADGSCAVTPPADCTGTWQGVNTTCDPNSCVPLTGACCYADGSCHIMSQTACSAQGGTYQGDGTGCAPNPCPSCDWARLWPQAAPSPRLDFGLTYDSARAVSVLFGGWDGGYSGNGHYGDTWEWDGANWTMKSGSGPCPRGPNHMAYDSARGVTVLFGGADADRVYGDTWEWDGTNWVLRSEDGPAPRDRHGLVYDSAHGVTVLFGGWGENWNLVYSDTWEWDGTTWTQRSVSGPSPRFEFGMVYDVARARTVVFGGCGPVAYELYGDTWEWDGTNWTQKSDNGPPARWGPAMAYDAGRGLSVLFAGITVNGWLSDTWEWDGTQWTHQSDSGPSPRWGSNMEYDGLRGVTTLFGGWSGSSPLDDTWQLACGPAGACCYADGSCAVTTPADCTGTWQGVNTTCDPNPCAPPIGACCLMDGSCIVIDPSRCAAQNGIYQGGYVPCEAAQCTPFYCPAGAETCDEYIARVQIGAIDNPSVCEAGQYADYTALVADVPYGDGTQLTVTNGNPLWTADVCSVWIDWNQDYVFDDGGDELIGDVPGVGPYVFNIVPPTSAAAGQTRMRIRIDYANSDPDPCHDTTYGEVEDYTVNVLNVPGACCWPDGSCTSAVPWACGGDYGGAFTACAAADCNSNGVDDFCDFASGYSTDCDDNGIPDECQPFTDCNENGVADFCDIANCQGGAWCSDCNNNGIPDECDIAIGTSLDCQPDGIPDECEVTPGCGWQIDDGMSESTWGLPDASELCWMNHMFAPSWEIVGHIAACFGSPSYPGFAGVVAGQPFRVYVWSDPNQDGNPNDAVFLGEATGTVEAESIDTDVVQVVTISPPIVVNGSFFIGASVVTAAGGRPAPADDDGWTGPPDQGFLTFNSVPFDPSNITANLYPMSALGYPLTVFLLRGAGAFSSDCNRNGVPDECDVPPPLGNCEGPDCSEDCQPNGIPDECEPDCQPNGRPDDCDIASGSSLDCNGNGIPDECDIDPTDPDGNGQVSPDCNLNGIPDECDLAAGASQDCNNNDIPDECDIANCPPGELGCCDCQDDGIPDGCQLWDSGGGGWPSSWDDGSSENSLGLTAGGELCWLHHFAWDYAGWIWSLQVCFGTPMYPGSSGVTAGQTVRVYVWNDPNGDGNPSDAVFVGESTGVADGASIDSDVFQTVAINRPVSASFFVGASVVTTGGYPAPLDENGPQHNEAWIVFNSAPFDPVNLGPQLYNMTDVGYPGNWLLRANSGYGCGWNDCNENGIPDECDIGVEWGGYCTGQGGCYPTTCESDWNHNGIPDSCELCGDLDYDGNVDLDDYWMFADAFGTCFGNPKYLAAADMDGDDCVTLADYQAWRMCYQMANGKEFTPPKPKPMPKPAVAQ